MAKITLDDLRHSYMPSPSSDADWALKQLDLEWEDGGAYALLGPSGCGKTTLLNIISGLLEPSHGSILFDDQDVTHLPADQRQIAQVFQFPVVYDTMTVYDNLAFPLRNRGVGGGQRSTPGARNRRHDRSDAHAEDPGVGADSRWQAEDLAGARPGAHRCQRHHVR
jgi:ABC-type sugar transport system ATPase subunit